MLSPSGLYAACLEDSNSGGLGRSELVIFSYSTFRNLTREQCHSVCFNESHRYGGLGEKHECLCSKNSDPNYISTSQCSAACTNPDVMKVCVKIIALSDSFITSGAPLCTFLYFLCKSAITRLKRKFWRSSFLFFALSSFDYTTFRICCKISIAKQHIPSVV